MPGKPFTDDDQPAPEDSYGISKWEAEVGLHQVTKETEMEVVIIRPALIYGPGVKANFKRMVNWVNNGYPMPLGSVNNKRSLLALENLVDLIDICIEHPAAANQTFLAADGEDLSTAELLQRTGKALGKKVRLIPFPVHLLEILASLLGKKNLSKRLLGSLQVDITRTRTVLEWEPSISVDEGLQKIADDYKI